MARPAIDVSKMTAEEKLDLIDELWQSLQPEDFALTDTQRAELDRRFDRIDRDGMQGVPWHRVRAKMTSKKS